jgi:hypothetical protein
MPVSCVSKWGVKNGVYVLLASGLGAATSGPLIVILLSFPARFLATSSKGNLPKSEPDLLDREAGSIFSISTRAAIHVAEHQISPRSTAIDDVRGRLGADVFLDDAASKSEDRQGDGRTNEAYAPTFFDAKLHIGLSRSGLFAAKVPFVSNRWLQMSDTVRALNTSGLTPKKQIQ